MSAVSTPVNTDLIEQEYLQFGKKYVHYPSLLKSYLVMNTGNKKRAAGWPRKAISYELKSMLLDLVYRQHFEQARYDQLARAEQDLFDRAVTYGGLQVHSIAKMKRVSDRERGEMIAEFDILKGEVLAGNDSKELIKKMRNLLIEMKNRKYISISKYNLIMSDILNYL